MDKWNTLMIFAVVLMLSSFIIGLMGLFIKIAYAIAYVGLILFMCSTYWRFICEKFITKLKKEVKQDEND